MKPSLMICTPTADGKLCAQTYQSICGVVRGLTHAGVRNIERTASASDLVRLRNMILTAWYDGSDYSHLMMVDADMEFPVELVAAMLRFNKPVMGVYYTRRQFPPSLVGAPFEDESIGSVQEGFVKCRGVGAGVLMIRREAIDEMLAKMPGMSDVRLMGYPPEPFKYKMTRVIRAFNPIDTEAGELSEDMSFCHRWRACGGDVWANVDHVIGHVGQFTWETRYMTYLEGQP